MRIMACALEVGNQMARTILQVRLALFRGSNSALKNRQASTPLTHSWIQLSYGLSDWNSNEIVPFFEVATGTRSHGGRRESGALPVLEPVQT
mmetsp:Transcript_18120/g.33761  ORF Transcript_18120/g.33761 Transcript_18120/m.33761 type:complete len:92 (-) Transcript_18120:103-378(-)